MTLSGKKIILGITGSIAAYKAVYLLRRLVEDGADVKVVMTREAVEFVSPLTYEVLSKHPVYVEMFDLRNAGNITHLNLGREADAIVVAPATANIIGKMANGICDDLLSTILVGIRCPVIMAPAMDYEMYESPVVQKNIASLIKELKVEFTGPVAGMLASGAAGQGRMSEPDDIFSFLSEVLSESINKSDDLEGHCILVTAGPTKEAIDPVRYISNSSSGKMGYAIAESARRRGAKVILISGPTSLTPPSGVEFINVITAEEMLHSVMNKLDESTIVVMTAAVSDFRPAEVQETKIKKSESITLKLIKTGDILEEISRKKENKFIIGFAAETEDLINNASEKLKSKHLDMIVANDISQPGAGFDVDTNIVTIIDRWGGIIEYPVMPKNMVAEKILDHLSENLRKLP